MFSSFEMCYLLTMSKYSLSYGISNILDRILFITRQFENKLIVKLYKVKKEF